MARNASVRGTEVACFTATLRKSSPRTYQSSASSLSIICAPAYSPAIRQIAPDNKGNLLLSQFLDCDLQRIRLALKVHQDRRVRDAGTGGAGRALALSSPTSLFRQPLRQDQQPTQAHSPAPSNPPLVVFPSSSLWSAMDSCYMGCNVTSCPYIETIEEG